MIYLVVDPGPGSTPVDLLGVCVRASSMGVLLCCAWPVGSRSGFIYGSTEVIDHRARGGDRGNIDESSSPFRFTSKKKESRGINRQIKAAIIQQLPLPR